MFQPWPMMSGVNLHCPFKGFFSWWRDHLSMLTPRECSSIGLAVVISPFMLLLLSLRSTLRGWVKTRGWEREGHEDTVPALQIFYHAFVSIGINYFFRLKCRQLKVRNILETTFRSQSPLKSWGWEGWTQNSLSW